MDTLIYDKKKSYVQCRICNHYCKIEDGQKGICLVRENQAGQLVPLTYKKVIASSIDPIEKKPIFHLKPGSSSYSIASIGCNFKCSFCQNANIAQDAPAAGSFNLGSDVNPADIVRKAIDTGCRSISYTYTEPTMFLELALDTARLAQQEGLDNIFVTNGYMSRETLGLLMPHLSAANIDLKAFKDKFYQKYCKARLAPVLESIETMKEAGILVELTTLLIPGLNDGEEDLSDTAEYIAGKLGRDTPWHISRFHPCYRMTDRPATPIQSLEKAYAIGKNAGLYHVYIGNVAGTDYENTYCHTCSQLLIRRYGYQTTSYLKDGGACPKCGSICTGIF